MKNYIIKGMYPEWCKALKQKAGLLRSVLCDLQIGDEPPATLWMLALGRIRRVRTHIINNRFGYIRTLCIFGQERAKSQVEAMKTSWLLLEEHMSGQWASNIQERQKVCSQMVILLDQMMTVLQLHPYPDLSSQKE
jgi:hypothetical protein